MLTAFDMWTEHIALVKVMNAQLLLNSFGLYTIKEYGVLFISNNYRGCVSWHTLGLS
jgi:hypothetical protein